MRRIEEVNSVHVKCDVWISRRCDWSAVFDLDAAFHMSWIKCILYVGYVKFFFFYPEQKIKWAEQ